MSRVGRSLAWSVLAGCVFGIVVAVVKGQDSGLRDALGNLSAPWVVLPFLAGASFRRPGPGAAAGLLVTLSAFAGFYTAEAFVLDLGRHSLVEDLRLTLGSGHIYETWGLISGPVYGALGAVWRGRSSRLASVPLCLAFICEPLIVFSAMHAGLWGGGELFRFAWLWTGEVALGVALLLAFWSARRPVHG